MSVNVPYVARPRSDYVCFPPIADARRVSASQKTFRLFVWMSSAVSTKLVDDSTHGLVASLFSNFICSSLHQEVESYPLGVTASPRASGEQVASEQHLIAGRQRRERQHGRHRHDASDLQRQLAGL